jgi:phenylpropionate dioxygenase-like ring-hydroxylating dioxygenase large terminal subunit
MSKTTDSIALNQWYVIGRVEDISQHDPRLVRLLGQAIVAQRDSEGFVQVHELGGNDRLLPVQERYGHVWTTLGQPSSETLFDIPEFEQPGRRLITCGAVRVRTCAARIVENFLDLSHFPFVHTNILGAEPRTEVVSYDVEVKEDSGEIWASNCQFYQPKAAASASEGSMVNYTYRVAAPFVTMLYKSSPTRPQEKDVIGLFIHPIEEDLCDVHSFVLVYDEHSSDVELLHFQQNIFLQDRIILENQVPRLIPLTAGMEKPIKADATSSAYRRMLRNMNLSFGVLNQSA